MIKLVHDNTAMHGRAVPSTNGSRLPQIYPVINEEPQFLSWIIPIRRTARLEITAEIFRMCPAPLRNLYSSKSEYRLLPKSVIGTINNGFLAGCYADAFVPTHRTDVVCKTESFHAAVIFIDWRENAYRHILSSPSTNMIVLPLLIFLNTTLFDYPRICLYPFHKLTGLRIRNNLAVVLIKYGMQQYIFREVYPGTENVCECSV